MENQRFFKTIITYEVLHDCEDDLCDKMSLRDIAGEIVDGDMSGMLLGSSTVELTKEEMQQALINQESDPHFIDCEDSSED